MNIPQRLEPRVLLAPGIGNPESFVALGIIAGAALVYNFNYGDAMEIQASPSGTLTSSEVMQIEAQALEDYELGMRLQRELAKKAPVQTKGP